MGTLNAPFVLLGLRIATRARLNGRSQLASKSARAVASFPCSLHESHSVWLACSGAQSSSVSHQRRLSCGAL